MDRVDRVCWDWGSGNRARNVQIEIFRDGQAPNRAWKEIGLLTDDGGLGEQGEIEAKMVRKAKHMGADAILFQPPVKSGGEVSGLSWRDTYLYKGVVVSYQ